MTNSSPSERLKDERLRCGLTQTQLAEAAGVSTRAQIRYETGESQPNTDYLAAIAALGIDILYIITGQRQVQSEWDDEDELEEEDDDSDEIVTPTQEEYMLALYRSLNEDERREIQAAAEGKLRIRELEDQLAAVLSAMAEMNRWAA